MNKTKMALLSGLAALSAVALMLACGTGSGPGVSDATPQPGSVVVFGTDAPTCGVESFKATITSAILVPQGGGNLATLISPTTGATADFARLASFTNILTTASVNRGTYNQLQITLTNPELSVLNTSTNPPTPQTINATLATTSMTITINPALVMSASTTSGLTLDFNLGKSLQVQGGTGQVTGVVNPQITLTANTNSGSSVGEADSLYGIIQGVSTSNLPTGFTGSFTLVPDDGTGQTLTILSNSSTVFEGDGVTNFSNLAGNTFAEVDAVVNTSGQVIAQVVDSEEPTSITSQQFAYLGKITQVVRNGSGNALSFSLALDDQMPYPSDSSGESGSLAGLNINVVLNNTTEYFINWGSWNRQAFTFGPATLGLGENVTVFGALTYGAVPTVTATRVFLRPRSVEGNFAALQAAGSDGVTGAFVLTPCSPLLGGKVFTVLTYPDSLFTGVGGLAGLTASPTLDASGLLIYQPIGGTTNTGGAWPASAWVMQARRVHQLPN